MPWIPKGSLEIGILKAAIFGGIEKMDIDEELFNLILQIGTYNGTACYDSYEDLLADENSAQGVSLTAAEVRRLVFTAYKMGKAEKTAE